jgi:hypothetical protein
MARTIQSPGVQINEVDLSLRAVGAPPTTVFISGFASKGPTNEPILVGSLSEYEQIFGTPTNGAERYFYHTTKAVFSSPANVMVYRLPYGDNLGVDTSDDYSAIVYPVASYFNGSSSTNLQFASGSYFFGKPIHVKLTEKDYLDILRGDAFTWSATAFNPATTRQINSISDLGKTGLVILNKSQSTINTKFEGYYVGIIDNTNLNPATPYDDINKVESINTDTAFISSYVSLPDVRLNFPLSATSSGLEGSISEVIENLGSFDRSTNTWDDTVTLGVFKLRQSVFSPNTVALDYLLEEGYVGSLDFYRQIQDQNGGPASSFFLENIDDASRNVVVLVNPYISNKDTGNTWVNLNNIPQKKVRFLSTPRGTVLENETAAAFETRVGTTTAQYTAFLNTLGSTDSIVALGDYTVASLTTKKIGNIPGKVTRMLDKVENSEIYPLTITVEGGLGTIYANSFNPATSGYFDDSVAFDSAVQALTAQNPTTIPAMAQNYTAAAGPFVDFASKKRKDHMFIADPITNIFVQGSVKTLEDNTKNFSTDIYWPLRNQFSTINTSYVALYGNCAKVADIASNRQVWVPFSGFAAAAMANTDSNTQPWFAPAGFTRGIITGIVDLGFYPKQTQRDALYKISLNPVVFFPNEGFVIFGQKTAQKTPSAFDRINVRRLFLDLEVKTRDTVRSFVFEPNSLFTRTQIKNVLAPIFDLAKNTQGLYDYLIICDERNNTPSVIDDNSLVVDIYLKPVRAAEFILVNFYATRTSTNFQEIVS